MTSSSETLSAISYKRPERRRGWFRRRSWTRDFWTRWLQRRLPPTDLVRFGRNNLFIFPAQEGTLFLVLLLIMLLTGINYQNSLVYLLTFLLGALFYVGILQTHDNLSGIELTLAGVEEGFAQSTLAVRLKLRTTSGGDRPAVSVSANTSTTTVDLEGDDPKEATLTVKPLRRGLYSIPRLQVETRYPMGLFRAWSYVWLKTPILVYPKPVRPPEANSAATGEQEGKPLVTSCVASDELLLRPYRDGDLLQRVQWKRFAKDDQMVVIEREPVVSDSKWLDYADFSGMDVEARLSHLAWLVEDCHGRGQLFAMRLPGSVLAPGSGPAHRREALRRLAMFGTAS